MMLLDETIQEQLKDGKIVRLGNIGSFQVGITSKGAETELKVTSKTISTAKLNFRAGKSLRNMLTNLTYEKVKG
jgi:predicted histone-like DNA-binding protein